MWRSVLEYTKSTTETAKRAEELLSSWPTQIKEDKNKVTSGLNNLRNEVNGLREAFATLATVYQRFPNIRATFQDKNFDQIFSRLFGDISSFLTEVTNLPPTPPQNFEVALKPFENEMESANAAMAKWASETHSFSEAQIRELNTSK